MLDPPGTYRSATSDSSTELPAPLEELAAAHDPAVSQDEHGESSAADGQTRRFAATPSRRRRLESLFEVIVCSGFPTQILVTLLLGVSGVAPFGPDGQISLRYVTWLSLIDTLLLTTLILCFIRVGGESAASIFLGRGRTLREIGLGVLLLPAAFVLVVAISALVGQLAPWLRNPDGNPLEHLMHGFYDIVLFAVVAMVAGGFREELQRAFVLHRFEQHLGGARVGLVIFSLGFGLGHAVQGWDATLMTGLLGAFWGIVYLWRRSIVAPATTHALFNLIEVVSHGLQA